MISIWAICLLAIANVYGGTAGAKGSQGPSLTGAGATREPDVLLVDDDGGKNYEEHLVQALVANSYSFDVWTVVDTGRGPTAAEMSSYGVVIWNTGDEFEETLTEADTFYIGAYLRALNGNVWLIGQNILYDFKYTHNPPWDYPSWIRITSHGEDVEADSAVGVVGDTVSHDLRLGLGAGFVLDRTDTIAPTDPDYACFTRKLGANEAGACAMRYEELGGYNYKFFFQVFPFENIESLADTLVQRVLTWFGYPPPSHTLDACVLSIDAPSLYLFPGELCDPQVTVKNMSVDSEAFWVVLQIDSAGTQVYSDSVFTQELAPDETYQVTFGGFRATQESTGTSYMLTAFVDLSSDEYPDNDTVESISTVSVIKSNRTANAPDLDGEISDGEWSDAVVLDISDRLGAMDAPNVPSSCLLYVMNDGSSLYLAFELFCDSLPGNGDQVLLRFDENRDGAWAVDSSEGTYYVIADMGGDYSLYTAYPSGYSVYNPETPRFDIGILPYRVFEIALDFGDEKWELSAWPGDTISMFCAAYDKSAGFPDDVTGFWPTSSPVPQWDEPGYFGELVIGYICGDVNGDGLVNTDDVGALTEYLFTGGTAPVPLRAGDVNGDGELTVADAVYLADYLYFDGPDPMCP